MRPSLTFLAVLAVLVGLQAGVIGVAERRFSSSSEAEKRMTRAVDYLGLSDLCIATDARYIRHPAVSDGVAPYMDHPGSLEHFPTGSFWVSPLQW